MYHLSALMISKADKDLLKKFDVVINVGDADTAQSGGENWIDETIITAVREFVYNGGGFIGVGEPAAHQWQGRFIQLDDVLGVEEEHGFNLNTDKYNWEEHRDHSSLKMQKARLISVKVRRTFMPYRKQKS